MRRFSLIACLSGISLLPALAFTQVKVEVGREAPDFTLEDATGHAYKLSDYRGKSPVVLEFFRSGGW